MAVAVLFGATTNLMIYLQRTGSDKVKTAQYWMMLYQKLLFHRKNCLSELFPLSLSTVLFIFNKEIA
ncbi:hypothetical protein [Lachnoanaerobaculum sp.]|uniref:hypothetical protein n=1 Tax=Lachnoanaerobaculum sp. TaxID=2049030 RepID=UPI0025BCECFE|nr:hypothetical protein [Lachnoanaerobaculum sp.]